MTRRIDLVVNGALSMSFNTDGAVAADYLAFLNCVLAELLKDKAALEEEANASGKTIVGHSFAGIGSIPLTSIGIPEVTDE